MSETKPFNPWSYKPWWCQPWSIALTGISLIFGSWLTFKLIWLSAIVAVPVSIWMGFFLLVWPKLMQEYYRELERGKGEAIEE
jgi:hypothetical protein